MSAKSADDPISEADYSVPPVTSDDIDPLKPEGGTTTMPSSGITPATPKSIGPGNASIFGASVSGSPSSKSSDGPSSSSKRRWRQPRNVREFAAQANAVTTMVLNGEMDLDKARQYSSVARTIAQAMSIEVTRARFLKEMPDLQFDEEVWDSDDDETTNID